MHWIRCLWTIALVVVTGCTNRASSPRGRLLVGVVAYGEEQQSLNRYDRFLTYLGESTQAIIELEPAHNELKAIERIESQTWSLAFAPPPTGRTWDRQSSVSTSVSIARCQHRTRHDRGRARECLSNPCRA
ncbi:MAG: hypothetical protein AAF704_11095 [Cyanobacteria bacterium P01_D01_bin.123]